MIRTVKPENGLRKETRHRIDVRILSELDDVQVLHFTLQPGESLKKHTGKIRVMFYVLEGTGMFEQENEKKEVAADTLIECPSGVSRRWLNNHHHPLRVLVIRLSN